MKLVYLLESQYGTTQQGVCSGNCGLLQKFAVVLPWQKSRQLSFIHTKFNR